MLHSMAIRSFGVCNCATWRQRRKKRARNRSVAELLVFTRESIHFRGHGQGLEEVPFENPDPGVRVDRGFAKPPRLHCSNGISAVGSRIQSAIFQRAIEWSLMIKPCP